MVDHPCLHPEESWVVNPHPTHYKSREQVWCGECGRFFGNRYTERYRELQEYWQRKARGKDVPNKVRGHDVAETHQTLVFEQDGLG